ncbi:MAG: hypothetical protein KDI55_09455 [Anaerolineae bacterium]|nr:hypothetical protein [Anaerolineae bacterium]
MFEELLRELGRLNGTHTVAAKVSSDKDGYFDRECPSAECTFQFKVHKDDWQGKVHDEEVFCPFCGHTAGSDSWWTQQQLKHAKEAALAQVEGRLSGAMNRDAQRWNRSQPKNSFISMTMKVDSRPQHVLLPPAAAEPMKLRIACPECACRYAVIGTAYFCPACGHNAADQMFAQSIEGIRKTLDAMGTMTAAIPDRDTAENTKRLIIEHGLQNAVTAFQRYAEALYSRFPSLPSPRRNAFQNLKEGSGLWHEATGKRYDDYLNAEDLKTLQRSFQQRHLLAHRQGLVDADYINKTSDQTYREGQRIVIRKNAVRECLNAIQKLAAAMTTDKPE